MNDADTTDTPRKPIQEEVQERIRNFFSQLTRDFPEVRSSVVVMDWNYEDQSSFPVCWWITPSSMDLYAAMEVVSRTSRAASILNDQVRHQVRSSLPSGGEEQQ